MKKTITAALMLLIIFTACNTAPPENSAPVIREKAGDIVFELQPLNVEELKERHGTRNNPFISYPGKVPRKYIMVYECHISSETTTVHFDLEDIVMDLNIGYSDNAKTQVTLLRSWEPYIDSDNAKADMNRIIKKELSKNNFTVTPEAPYKGYIVFIVKTKGATEGNINIPAETATGDKGVVTLPISFLDENASQHQGDSIFGKKD